MVELDNITLQLTEITSEKGIPIGSGGPLKEYLCAVSRGLIQFVCVSSAPGVYRSLTADKIHIHPGSLMFRETPRYIVAGEIVNTSRIFARSVSPLQKKWLDEIYPHLSEQLVPGPRELRGAKEKARDTSWEVKIGTESFQLKPHKGKHKIAILPWERFSSAARRLDPAQIPRYKGLLATITYEGSEIIVGERLTTLLRATPTLSVEKGIRREWPRGRTFSIPKELPALCEQLDGILTLCGGPKKGSPCGFLSLNTKGNGAYWFRCARHFEAAATMSLSSLEALADELDPSGDEECRQKINATYRRLSELLES